MTADVLWKPLSIDVPGAPPSELDRTGVVALVPVGDRAWAAGAAVTLARSLARGGRRVFLCDLDLEAPRLHDMVGVVRGAGVTDYALYGASPSHVATEIEDRLHFVSAGTPVAGLPAVFQSGRWDAFFEAVVHDRGLLMLFLPARQEGASALLDRVGSRVALGDPVGVPQVSRILQGVRLGFQPTSASVAAIASLAPEPEEEALDVVPPEALDSSEPEPESVAFEPEPVDPAEATPLDVVTPEFLAPDDDDAVDIVTPEFLAPDAGDPNVGDLDVEEPGDLAGLGEVVSLDALAPDEPLVLDEPPVLDEPLAPADPLATEEALAPVEPEHSTAGPSGAEPVDDRLDGWGEDVTATAEDLASSAEEAVPTPEDGSSIADAFAGADAGGDEISDPEPSSWERGAAEIGVGAIPGEGAGWNDLGDEPSFESQARAEGGGRRTGSLMRIAMLFLLVVVVAIAAGRMGWVDVPGVASRRGDAGESPAQQASEAGDPAPTAPAGAAGEDTPATQGGEAEAAAAPPPASSASVSSPHQVWSLRIGAYTSQAVARREAAAIADRVRDHVVVIAPVDVNGRRWWRVISSLAPDRETAEGLRTELGAALTDVEPADWLVRRAPSAFLLDETMEIDTARASAEVFRERGIDAYVMAVARDDGSRSFRVYAGAYANAEEAAVMRELLVNAGVDSPALVERRGVRPE